MNVQFLNIRAACEELRPTIDEAYQRVMDSAWFILGKELEAFEAEFAQYCNSRYCIGVGNGLDALQLILSGYDIGPGDEVIVPSMTFIATWLAVTAVGATPIPVEPDPHTCNLDPTRVAEAITARTRAIIAVHLYGQPADMEALQEIASSRGIKLIEDNAQAQGATVGGRRTGALSDAAATSFYPGKNLGAYGDGGAITTNDSGVYEKVMMLRNYGSVRKYHHDIPGTNSRLDELQAAFLRAKLRMLDDWNKRRQAVAAAYLDSFAPLPGVRVQHVPARFNSVWHIFSVHHNSRGLIQSKLAEVGISTQIHYPVAPSLSGAYAHLGYKPGHFPIAESIASSQLSLPIGPHLDSSEVEYVISQFTEVVCDLA